MKINLNPKQIKALQTIGIVFVIVIALYGFVLMAQTCKLNKSIRLLEGIGSINESSIESIEGSVVNSIKKEFAMADHECTHINLKLFPIDNKNYYGKVNCIVDGEDKIFSIGISVNKLRYSWGWTDKSMIHYKEGV